MTSAEMLLKKVQAYTPGDRAAKALDSTRTTLIVGITAAGKDTIIGQLRNLPDYHFLVSHTTRAPRPNNGVLEQNGVDYHFIDLSTAERMIDNHEFIEANMFSGQVYGTSVAEVEAAHEEGKVAINDVEVKGVDNFMQLSGNVRPIFILPPSYTVWQERFMRRYGDHAEQYTEDIARRLKENMTELKFALQKPYFIFVVNDDLHACVQETDQLARGAAPSADHQAKGRQIITELIDKLSQHLGSLDS